MSKPTEYELGAKEVFDRRAPGFDASYDEETTGGHLQRARLAASLRLLGQGPGKLLDVGCGSGCMLAAAAQRGWTGTGIDGAPAMVELARTRAPSATVLFGEVSELPFDDGTFDAVTALGILEYVDTAALLGEIARLLRSDGVAVMSFRCRGCPYRLIRDYLVHPIVRGLGRLGAPVGQPPNRRFPAGDASTDHLLRASHLEPDAEERVARLVVPYPVDEWLPRISVRLAEGAEGRARLARLASLRIVRARKHMLSDC